MPLINTERNGVPSFISQPPGGIFTIYLNQLTVLKVLVPEALQGLDYSFRQLCRITPVLELVDDLSAHTYAAGWIAITPRQKQERYEWN